MIFRCGQSTIEDDALAALHDPRVVSDDHDRLRPWRAFRRRSPRISGRCLRVEVASRLVGEDQRGLVDDARAIAARWRCPPELRRPVLRALEQEPTRAGALRARARLRSEPDSPAPEPGLDVALERRLRSRVEGLEHEADLLVADPGQLEPEATRRPSWPLESR
jgi:hypothetical protein